MVEKEKEALAVSIKLLYDVRAPRIKAIAGRGRKMDGGKKKMSKVEEYDMYCFFWLMMHLPLLSKYSGAPPAV